MSWMDSWSRPGKSQAVPPPYYLTDPENVRYCHTCGRVIGSRRTKASKTSATEVKYCSERCKRHKPSTAPDSLESKIERTLFALLEGLPPPGPDGEEKPTNVNVSLKHKPKKGDPRIIVKLSELEMAVYGKDPDKINGQKRSKRGIPDAPEWKSVDMEDPQASTAQLKQGDGVTTDDDRYDTAGSYTASEDEQAGEGGVQLNSRVRKPQTESDVNFSVGGERGWAEKIDETPEMLAKRREGQKRAEEKELAKSVARRAVVFGLLVEADVGAPGEKRKKQATKKGDAGGQELEGDGKRRRKCEALMSGGVVEPSFAKGDWSIRWREE